MASAAALKRLKLTILDPIIQLRNVTQEAKALSFDELEALWNQYQACGESEVYIRSDLEILSMNASIVQTLLKKVNELGTKVMEMVREGEEDIMLEATSRRGSREGCTCLCTCKQSSPERPLEMIVIEDSPPPKSIPEPVQEPFNAVEEYDELQEDEESEVDHSPVSRNGIKEIDKLPSTSRSPLLPLTNGFHDPEGLHLPSSSALKHPDAMEIAPIIEEQSLVRPANTPKTGSYLDQLLQNEGEEGESVVQGKKRDRRSTGGRAKTSKVTTGEARPKRRRGEEVEAVPFEFIPKVNSDSTIIIPLRTYQFEGECGASGRQACFLALENQELSIWRAEPGSDARIVLLDCTQGGNEIVDIDLPDEGDIPLVLFLKLKTANSRSNALLRCGFDLRHATWNRTNCLAFLRALREMGEGGVFSCTTITFGRQLEILVRLEEDESEVDRFSNRHTFSLAIEAYGQSLSAKYTQSKAPTEKALALTLSSQFSTSLRYRLFYCDGLDLESPSFYLESDKNSNEIMLTPKEMTGIRICSFDPQILVIELKAGTLLTGHFPKAVRHLRFKISNDDFINSSAILETIAKRIRESDTLTCSDLGAEEESVIIKELDRASKSSGNRSLLAAVAMEQDSAFNSPSPSMDSRPLPSLPLAAVPSDHSSVHFDLPPLPPPFERYVIPLRMYRSGTAPNLDNEVVTAVLGPTLSLELVLETRGPQDPAGDILTIRLVDVISGANDDKVVIKASDKQLRELMIPAENDQAYIICFHIAPILNDARIYQCGIDRNHIDWDPKIFNIITDQISLWSTKKGTISAEIYSLRYQLSIVADMEETQNCPMEKRKVLNLPLKTFSLGQYPSSLQADGLGCSLYQVQESTGRSQELVVYSATPGPMGHFTLAESDIAGIQIPDPTLHEPQLMVVVLTNLNSSDEFLNHFPGEQGIKHSYDLRLVIDPTSADFIENEFKEICKRFRHSWDRDTLQVSVINPMRQHSLAVTIRDPSALELPRRHSSSDNQKKRRVDSPERHSSRRESGGSSRSSHNNNNHTSSHHRRLSGKSHSSPRNNSSRNEIQRNDNVSSSRNWNYDNSHVNSIPIPMINSWGSNWNHQPDQLDYNNDHTGSFGKEVEETTTSDTQQKKVAEWIPIPVHRHY